MKKIGLVIPHYNSVQTIIRLLNSIYQRNNIEELFEIVIVDDRSTEDITLLKEKVTSLDNVKLLVNDSLNKGAGACRNIGMQYISSDWVMFADADDYFEKDLYSKVLKHIDDKVDIVYFNCMSREEKTNTISNRHIFLNEIANRYYHQPNEKNKTYLKFNWIVPWGKMIKRSILEENNIKFDEIIVSNDVMFSIKLAIHVKDITVSPDVIYCVTKSSGSLTTTNSEENYRIRSNIIIEKNKFLRKHLKKTEIRRLDNYSSRWLLDGYFIYQIKLKELLKFYVLFRKNGIPFFPSINNIKKLKRFIKDTKIEKKYSSLN